MPPKGRKSGLPGEFELIHRYFAPLAAKAPLAFGLSDDAAVVRPPKGMDLVVTKDAIVEGVHFLPDDPAERVAQKLLRVNLSDLAAKGAVPAHYLLATAFPAKTKAAWVAGFARGLAKDQRRYDVTLIGGDTVGTPGPLTLSLTMFGYVRSGKMRRRAGARPGDRLFVTGSIGDSAFGLSILKDKGHRSLSAADRAYLAGRYQLPEPRVAFGVALRGLASASIDVSDGLLADLGHLAKTSNVAAVVELDQVPLSKAGRAVVSRASGALLTAVSHGDDYEILFTVPKRSVAAMLAIAKRTRTPVSEIGVIAPGTGVWPLNGGGAVPIPKRGFTHF